MNDPIERPSARVLIIDGDDRLLLLHAMNSGSTSTSDFWFTPGGALEAGESYEDAARRELWEELGVTEFELGPWVRSRDTVFPWEGQTFHALERYFVVRVERLDDVSPGNALDYEADAIANLRWWSAAELVHATGETLFPPGLAQHYSKLLMGLPDYPIDLPAH